MDNECERYADPIYAGCARAEEWIADQIAEQRYQLSIVKDNWPYGIGRCKNCGEHMDDARPYCDEPCRSDHWDRIKAEKRRGK